MTPTPQRLGDRFAAIIRNALTEAELQTVRERNASDAWNQAHPDCCATHDFIDSNMAMLDAMESFGITPFDGAGGLSPEAESLWSAAWTYARDTNFNE